MEEDETDEENTLEDITSVEFEENLESHLEEAQDEYNNVARAYNKYSRDKERYHLTYYRKDGILYYERLDKKPIGF